MRILIGYASAAGSTRGIAEHLATRLEGAGHVAVVESVDRVADNCWLRPGDAQRRHPQRPVAARGRCGRHPPCLRADQLAGIGVLGVVDRRDELHRIPEVGTVSARPNASA
jgi:hypothetical protein